MKTFLIVLSSVLAAASTRAALFTNSASADSFVRAAAPTLNYGGAGALSVSGATAVNGSGVANGVSDTFIRFNTGAMVTNFNSMFGSNNWTITGAKLQVTEVGAPGNGLFNRGQGAFEIRWVANETWIEGTGVPNAPTTTGITYNDESGLLNNATDVRVGVFTNAAADGMLSFPLALPGAFVNNIKAGGEAGFYLTAIDPGTGFTMDSRNFVTVASRPVLVVSVSPRPGLTSISLAGTDVILGGTNGAAGGTYYVVASTNAILPLNQWLPIATNVLGVDGNFAVRATNAVSGGALRQFFIIQTR